MLMRDVEPPQMLASWNILESGGVKVRKSVPMAQARSAYAHVNATLQKHAREVHKLEQKASITSKSDLFFRTFLSRLKEDAKAVPKAGKTQLGKLTLVLNDAWHSLTVRTAENTALVSIPKNNVIASNKKKAAG